MKRDTPVLEKIIGAYCNKSFKNQGENWEMDLVQPTWATIFLNVRPLSERLDSDSSTLSSTKQGHKGSKNKV